MPNRSLSSAQEPTIARTASSPTRASTLSRLGDYQLLRPLGQGGMSTVFLAYRPGEAQVAVKILAECLAGNPNHVERFRREARSSIVCDHPNLVRGLAAGRDPETGRHYLVLEYIPGLTAHEWLAEHGTLSVPDAVHLATDLGRALEYLHRYGVVHRDIKPENIILSPSGNARLLDLGLARRLDDLGEQLTALDQRFGTPYYMPFEQALNAHFVDGRSDLFALGATLYHLLTGSVPFPGDEPSDITRAKELGVFVPASALNKRVPAALDAIFTRLLAPDPRKRFQSASELLVALERTGLAAPLPSWGRLSEALRDPSMRQRLTAPTAPTQLDLPPVPHTPADPLPALRGPIWLLRTRSVDGSWHYRKATTERVLRWAKSGRMPADISAARAGGRRVWRPLRTYPEFRHLPSPVVPAALRPVPSIAPTPPRAGGWRLAFLGLAAVGALALVGAAVLAGPNRWFGSSHGSTTPATPATNCRSPGT